MDRVNIETGSVITGTLRPEDLLPAFWDEAARVCGESWERVIHEHALAYRPQEADTFDFTGDDAAYDLDALLEILNEFAPEGLYFGSLEGDGADFGWWEEA